MIYSYNAMISLAKLEEKRGILRILVTFENEKDLNLSEIRKANDGLGTNSVRHAVERLLEIKLIEKVPSEKFTERRFRLTKNGQDVVQHLKEIELLLSS